jgi:hypothetical protein
MILLKKLALLLRSVDQIFLVHTRSLIFDLLVPLQSTTNTVLDLAREVVNVQNRHAAVVHALSATARQLRLATTHVSDQEGVIRDLQDRNAELYAAIAVAEPSYVQASGSVLVAVAPTKDTPSSTRTNRMIELVQTMTVDLTQVGGVSYLRLIEMRYVRISRLQDRQARARLHASLADSLAAGADLAQVRLRVLPLLSPMS